MALMKELLAKKAIVLGADDAVWTAYQGRAMLMVFCRYGLAIAPPYKGEIQLSNYYAASNRGYRIIKKLEQYAQELHINAEERKEHDVKKIAAAFLGSIGKNTLFYHPKFGSLTSLHILETDIADEDVANKPQDFCKSCKICAKACPGGAITSEGFIKEKCVRFHMSKPQVPEKYALEIYQLLGCEICQKICPQNPQYVQSQNWYNLLDILEGKHLADIKELVGSNYGRRNILLRQAMFYAANTGYTEAIPIIEKYVDDPELGEAARFAMQKLCENGTSSDG